MFADHSAIFAGASASLQAVLIDSQLTVLLHVNKLIAKYLAKNTVCPLLHSYRFAQNCCFQNPQTDNTPYCHEPYSTSQVMCHAATQTFTYFSHSSDYEPTSHNETFHSSTSDTAGTPGTSPVPLVGAVNSNTKTKPPRSNPRARQASNTSEEWTTVRALHHRSRSRNHDHPVKQYFVESEGWHKCKTCSAEFHLSNEKKMGSLSADYKCLSDVLHVGQTRKITRQWTHKQLPPILAYHSCPIDHLLCFAKTME